MRLLVTGYQAMDLGIFQDKDPRLKIIKKAISQDLEVFLEDGLEWLIFTGQLGFEYWVLEVALGLRQTYDVKIATLFPFETHGQNWNDQNQEKLVQFKAVDFIKYTYPVYEKPSQFYQYHKFLMEHTDGAYIFYDRERETRLKFLYEKLAQEEEYQLFHLTFDKLNEVAENFSEFGE